MRKRIRRETNAETKRRQKEAAERKERERQQHEREIAALLPIYNRAARVDR